MNILKRALREEIPQIKPRYETKMILRILEEEVFISSRGETYQ